VVVEVRSERTGRVGLGDVCGDRIFDDAVGLAFENLLDLLVERETVERNPVGRGSDCPTGDFFGDTNLRLTLIILLPIDYIILPRFLERFPLAMWIALEL
jgi:hypothetical protein